MAARKLELTVPHTIWKRLDDCEKRTGIRKEDLVMRALIKVIEEFEE